MLILANILQRSMVIDPEVVVFMAQAQSIMRNVKRHQVAGRANRRTKCLRLSNEFAKQPIALDGSIVSQCKEGIAESDMPCHRPEERDRVSLWHIGTGRFERPSWQINAVEQLA